MQDWDVFSGFEQVPVTLAHDPNLSPADEIDWFPLPSSKEFDDFGPMFGSEAGDGGDATNPGDIDVLGERYEEPWWDIDNLPSGDSGGDPVIGGDGSGGGDTPPGQQGHQGENCATAAIQAEIDSKPTNNTAEHTAAVYRGSDGLYYNTPVFVGTGGTVAVAQLISWMLSNNIDFSQLTSLYHNHDDASVPNDPTNIGVNRYPSHLYASNGSGDWAIADLFVNPHPSLGQTGGADPNVFKLTIEDTNGVARDFLYADAAKYKALTKQEMEVGKDLPGAETGCGGA